MDGISVETISSSIEAMSDVMEMAQIKSIELAEKMVAVQTEIALSLAKEAGKGEVIDMLV